MKMVLNPKQLISASQKRPILVTFLCLVAVFIIARELSSLFKESSGVNDESHDQFTKYQQLQQSSQSYISKTVKTTESTSSPGSAIANHCTKDQIPLYHLPVSSGAKCLDGSQPAFYYRRSPTVETASKWHVHFEGGGWCWDLAWCNNRADTNYGSSKSYSSCLPASSMNQKDIFSTSEKLNPYLHNWQTVHVKYCDGTSYTSNAVASYKGRKLYFKGQVNRDTTINYLLHQLNMRNATEIVISGCSAGGLAVYMGLDHITSLIHAVNPRVHVRGLALSGFFADYSALENIPTAPSSTGIDSYKNGISATSPVLYQTRDDGIVHNQLDYANALRRIYTMTNMSAGIHSTCIKNRGVNCVFAKILAPYLRTPVFSIQPQYDSWQLLHILSKNFSDIQGDAFGQQLQVDMKQAFFHSSSVSSLHGLYVESCAHHCFGCNPDINEDAWNGIHIRAQLLPISNSSSNEHGTSSDNKNNLRGRRSTRYSNHTIQSNPSPLSFPPIRASRKRIQGSITPAKAFQMWYEYSLKQKPTSSSLSNGGALPPLFFLQDSPFPCNDCCQCTAMPLSQSPPALLTALASKAIYVIPPELQG